MQQLKQFEQQFRQDLDIPTDQGDRSGLMRPIADIDTPLSEGYAYTRYYAAGGKVDIDVHILYLNPMDARAYATKSQQSILEGVAWFGSSFIPVAGAYLSTLGLLKTVTDSIFVDSIRKYADVDQSVKIIITHDKWYGMTYRTATYWNGLKDTVRSDSSLNQDYKISSYVNYKY